MERRKYVGHIVGILFTFSTVNAQAESKPVKLSDTQLDNVTAGFVEFTITANSFAAGSDVVVISHTSANLRSNGNGRTFVRGSAISTAIGDIVLTEAGYSLNTDENIISLRAVQRISNSENGTVVVRMRMRRDGRVTVTTTQRPARNGRRNNDRRITETNTLTVRAVTQR